MNKQGENPYQSLEREAYWRTAIVDEGPARVEHLWRPKLRIDKHSTLVTLGSCFARHIGARLRANGYRWLNSEAADVTEPFSFRTGNIYTASELRQWVEAAAQCEAEPDRNLELVQHEGRHFNLFRPSVPDGGFVSQAAAHADHVALLRTIQAGLSTADVVVFTLGLTECWRRADSTTYPMCPGVLCGAFDPVQHRFHNMDHAEVRAEIERALAAIQQLNPAAKLLLTVSPVPLAATASGQHVLTATTHSKAILRAVAGELAAERDDVDYFPSYEIITSPIFRGRFYEPNLRSVRPEGVDFVMHQFFRALEPGRVRPTQLWNGDDGAKHSAATHTTIHAVPDERVCDEAKLDLQHREELAGRVFLGDSHMDRFQRESVHHGPAGVGGCVMAASSWDGGLFHLPHPHELIPIPADGLANWTALRSTAGLDTTTGAGRVLITNVGCHLFRLTQAFVHVWACQSLLPGNENGAGNQSARLSFLVQRRAAHLRFVRSFIERGFIVVWISDPPYFHNGELDATWHRTLLRLFEGVGCRVFDSLAFCSERGGFGDHLRTPDGIHGSEAYYAQAWHFIRERLLPEAQPSAA